MHKARLDLPPGFIAWTLKMDLTPFPIDPFPHFWWLCGSCPAVFFHPPIARQGRNYQAGRVVGLVERVVIHFSILILPLLENFGES